MHTDMLFNSPRVRLSRQAMEAILSYARALGALNVPTYYAWKKFRESIAKQIGDYTEFVVTNSGHNFYVNSIVKTLALVSCFALPGCIRD